MRHDALPSCGKHVRRSDDQVMQMERTDLLLVKFWITSMQGADVLFDEAWVALPLMSPSVNGENTSWKG